VTTAYRLWDKHSVQNPAKATQPPVAYRQIDPQTGEVTDLPTPPPASATHLASHLPLVTNPQPKPSPSASTPEMMPPLAYSLLDGQGTARWRRELAQQNRDKVIVFKDHRYGIFDTHELMVLSGIPVRDLPAHLGSRTDILRRYGCLPNSP